MSGLYKHISLLIASTVFMLSFLYKFIVYFEVEFLFILKDFVLFVAVYTLCKIIFSSMESIFNTYRKMM